MNASVQQPPIPPLRDGERLTREEFHRRYEAHPDGTKFELIGGVVHMASPTRNPHGGCFFVLNTVLGMYAGATPGVQGFADITTILGAESEAQPDLILRILPSHGGRTWDDEEYLHNGPEFVAQVSHSTVALDTGDRRTECQNAGVCEYLVVDIPGQRLRWFDFRAGGEIAARGGIIRSRVFPGLWIAPAALLAGDIPRLTEVIRQGTAGGPHGRFVRHLERERQRLARSS